MYCENKNHLLDLYFLEGSEEEHAEMTEHIKHCGNCREYLESLTETMDMLSELKEEEPGKDLFSNILSEVSVSVPKPSKKRTGVELVPVLQIAFGEIFLFSLIYFIKMQITLLPFWKIIERNWIIQSLGDAGVSVVLVLVAGSFITLAMAPILLMESDRKNSFN
ncbi:MAG: anti-sigma factor family protein [Syntrophomonadaceae bacterium]